MLGYGKKIYYLKGNMIEVNRKKNASINLITRYLSLLLSMVMSVFMVPLYLKYIPLNEYSAWLVTGNILAWLSAADPGLTIVLQQKIAFSMGKDDRAAIGNFIFAGLAISIIIIVSILLIGFTLSYILPSLFSSEISNVIKTPFLITVIGTALMLFSYILFSINQGLQGSLGIGIIGIFSSLLSLLLTIILLKNGYKIYSISYGILAGAIVNISGQYFFFLKKINIFSIKILYNKVELKSILKLLGQTFLGRLSGILANNLDLLIISKFVNPATLVFYTMSRKTVDISRGFIEQPILAILPGISHLIGTNEIDKIKTIFSKLFHLMTWILTFIFIGFIFFNKTFVSLWLGDKYYIGDEINLYICIALFLSTVSSIFQNISYSVGNIRTTSTVSTIHSFLYIILLHFFTSKLSIYGPPFAIICSLIFLPLWFYPYMLGKKISGLNFYYWKIIKEFLLIITLTTPFLIFKYFYLTQSISWISFFLSLLFYCVYFFIILFFISNLFKLYIKDFIFDLHKCKVNL